MKSNSKFGYINLVRLKQPGQRHGSEYSMAVSLDYRRKKNVKIQYNTHPKHSKMAGTYYHAEVKNCCKANWHPSHQRLVDYQDCKLFYMVHSTLCLRVGNNY